MKSLLFFFQRLNLQKDLALVNYQIAEKVSKTPSKPLDNLFDALGTVRDTGERKGIANPLNILQRLESFEDQLKIYERLWKELEAMVARRRDIQRQLDELK